MPIYEYACRACEHQFETMQKISEDPLVDCPSCGQPDLKKLVSRAAFRLKGAGWYETDFKSEGKKNIAGDATKSSSDSSNGTSDASGGSKDSAGGSDKSSSGSSEPSSKSGDSSKKPSPSSD